MAKLVLNHVRENFKQHYEKRTDIKASLLKLMKKASNLILTNDEQDLNNYLSEMKLLFGLFESYPEISDLYQWIHLTTKFYEYLKTSKNKTSILDVNILNDISDILISILVERTKFGPN